MIFVTPIWSVTKMDRNISFSINYELRYSLPHPPRNERNGKRWTGDIIRIMKITDMKNEIEPWNCLLFIYRPSTDKLIIHNSKNIQSFGNYLWPDMFIIVNLCHEWVGCNIGRIFHLNLYLFKTLTSMYKSKNNKSE